MDGFTNHDVSGFMAKQKEKVEATSWDPTRLKAGT